MHVPAPWFRECRLCKHMVHHQFQTRCESNHAVRLVHGTRFAMKTNKEMMLYCIALYSSIYIAPLNSCGPTEALLVRLARKKRYVLRSDKEVKRI